MPSSVATTLQAAISRVMDDLAERIATDGLVALKKTLDEAGASERLKQYEIYSHVSDTAVIFEIVVDADRVVATDPKTMAAIRTEASKLRKQMMAKVTKSFEMGLEGPRRVVRDARAGTTDARSSTRDARSRVGDARRPALDARKRMGTGGSADMDQIENPRGMELTPDGKLAVTLERSTSSGKLGLKIPKDSFQGLLGDFMSRLNDSISVRFASELESIVAGRQP